MERDTGLRRTALLTGALVAVSVAGTAVVGIAAYASDSSKSTSVDSPAPSGDQDFPSLSGTDDGGQATSGGS